MRAHQRSSVRLGLQSPHISAHTAPPSAGAPPNLLWSVAAQESRNRRSRRLRPIASSGMRLTQDRHQVFQPRPSVKSRSNLERLLLPVGFYGLKSEGVRSGAEARAQGGRSERDFATPDVHCWRYAQATQRNRFLHWKHTGFWQVLHCHLVWCALPEVVALLPLQQHPPTGESFCECSRM